MRIIDEEGFYEDLRDDREDYDDETVYYCTNCDQEIEYCTCSYLYEPFEA